MEDKILHQDDVEEVIDDQLARTSDHAAIADLTATASASYVQAESTATRGKVNEILDVLRDAGLIPAA